MAYAFYVNNDTVIITEYQFKMVIENISFADFLNGTFLDIPKIFISYDDMCFWFFDIDKKDFVVPYNENELLIQRKG